MEHKRRFEDSVMGRLIKLWPVLLFVGASIVTYTKLGSTVEWHTRKLAKHDIRIGKVERNYALSVLYQTALVDKMLSPAEKRNLETQKAELERALEGSGD